jgi:hypothetical protein
LEGYGGGFFNVNRNFFGAKKNQRKFCGDQKVDDAHSTDMTASCLIIEG